MTAREASPALAAIVAILRPPLMVLMRREWHGAELLPDTGFVLAVNHISYIDPLVVSHFVNDAGIPPRFLAKASLLDLPLLGRLLRASGQIPVYRDSTEAANAFTAAAAALERGECVIVYPEGTLTRDPAWWPMVGKTGAARLALATGCPVIPVAQWGAQEILAPYGRRVRLFPRRTIRIRVGKPVDLSDLQDQPITGPVLRNATERIMAAITRELEVLRGEKAPAQRFDPRARASAGDGPSTREATG